MPFAKTRVRRWFFSIIILGAGTLRRKGRVDLRPGAPGQPPPRPKPSKCAAPAGYAPARRAALTRACSSGPRAPDSAPPAGTAACCPPWSGWLPRDRRALGRVYPRPPGSLGDREAALCLDSPPPRGAQAPPAQPRFPRGVRGSYAAHPRPHPNLRSRAVDRRAGRGRILGCIKL